MDNSTGLIKIVLPCRDCGKPVEATFKSEYSAKRCHKKLCPACKAEHARSSAEKAKEKYKKTHYTERALSNDEINKACDNFFRKRDIKLEQPNPMPFMKEDTSRAVSYGESAARRYMNMKGKKDGN